MKFHRQSQARHRRRGCRRCAIHHEI